MSAAKVQILKGKEVDLGGIKIKRVLPQIDRKMIGPFIFLDKIGPGSFPAGKGIDVRPHPHIGLATVTYLFEGSLTHRDSLGFTQVIRPGDLNWMTAGRGITHSERTGQAERLHNHSLYGLQFWVALPVEAEETEPAFRHHAKTELPDWEEDPAHFRLIAGKAMGRESPAVGFSPLFYIEVKLRANSHTKIPQLGPEQGLFLLKGELSLNGNRILAEELAAINYEGDIEISSGSEPAHFVLFGGDPVGPRIISWNFVSSRPERIVQAEQDWLQGKFPPVEGDAEFIPLPGKG